MFVAYSLLASLVSLEGGFAFCVGLVRQWVKLTKSCNLCTLTIVTRCCTRIGSIAGVSVESFNLCVLVSKGLLGCSERILDTF